MKSWTFKHYNELSLDELYLILKIRQEKNKQKKENLIFIGLICGLVTVTGIIASF